MNSNMQFFKLADNLPKNVELPGVAKHIPPGYMLDLAAIVEVTKQAGYLIHMPEATRSSTIAMEVDFLCRQNVLNCISTDLPSVEPSEPPAVPQEESLKWDDGKLPFDLLPVEALEDVVRVFQYGANKYSPRNWEKPGFCYSRLFSASMRHLWAWWRGDGIDPESGLPHLAHAATNVLFLLQYSYSGAGTDDRPTRKAETTTK